MSIYTAGHQPRVKLTTTGAGGLTYNVPVYNLNGDPAPINLTPIDPFDQVNVVGDTAKALDRRVDRIIPSVQTGGAGRDKYVETEGVTDFRQSDADTRAEGVIVCRAKRTAKGSITTGAGGVAEGMRVEYAGYAGASLHAWRYNGNLFYWSGAAWVGAGSASSITGYVRGFGYTFVADVINSTVRRSTDGINFVDICTAATMVGNTVTGIAVHDGKLWTIGYANAAGLLRLYVSTNPSAAAGAVTWTVAASTPMAATADEVPVTLFVWKDGAGSPALAILTSQRMLIYNPVGQTLEEYDDFRVNNPEGGPPTPSYIGICAAYFKTTGDLFVGQGQHNDYLMRYSPGAGFAKATPNRYGGLYADRQGSPRTLAQNAYGLGCWTTATSVVGGAASSGGAWFIDAQGGWHMMNRDITATKKVWGGGIGGRKYYTVFSDGTVEEQDLPNVGNKPQFAVGRKYDINTNHTHYYAKTDFGSEGTRFALLGFDVFCVLSDGSGTFGIDGGTTIKIEYRLNNSNGAWTVVTQYLDTTAAGYTTIATGLISDQLPGGLGVFTNWPVRMAVNEGYGVSAYALEWRATLNTPDENKTPVLLYVAPRAKKTPPPHYSYDFVVDAADFLPQGMQAGGVAPMPFGVSPISLATNLRDVDRFPTMVKIQFGLGGVEYSDICEFAMAPQLHPHAGIGRYRISLRSVQSDPSG